MDAEKLKEITAAANEAVKDLPADLKQSAFQTILNKLLETGIKPVQEAKTKNVSKPKKKVKSVKSSEPSEFEEQTKKLVEGLNRTEYPAMFKFKVTLDRSLYLLKIAKDKLKVDGLVPSQIATVLGENFRIKATKFSVSMSLMEAKKYVNRKPIVVQGGSGFIYHLAHEGEKYIDEKLKELEEPEAKKAE